MLQEAFLDRVRLVAGLEHPNLVRIHGALQTADGAIAVVMEYVPGGDLVRYRSGSLEQEVVEACRIVRQAAEGVSHAHRNSLLHGALHPERILLAADGTAKVGGFHRSVVREGTDPYSASPDSLPYLSPEQLGVVRDLPALDYRTDLYALGVILYELLTGQRPFEGSDCRR